MAQAIDEIIKNRKEKLEKLEAVGLSGFPAWEGVREPIAVVREKKQAAAASVVGRISAIRGHGKLVFLDLIDESGKIQISFKPDNLGKAFTNISLLDMGDFISASGSLYTTEAGELTIEAAKFSLLTKALRPLPSSWYGFNDVEERYRQRYVDLLVNPEVKEVFLVRTKITKLLRQKLDAAGFTEVETPVLQPLYGGATAKPFITHHNALDIDLYLRISDELYLKRLIVAGFEKVYEIAKDFRNEGIDRQHNPEFTMLEFYWAYANYEDLMKFTEEMLSAIVKEIKGSYKFVYQGQEYDFTPPWPRVSFRDLIKADTGIDINVANTEGKLLAAIKKTETKLDLEGVVGYAALLDTFYKVVSRPKIIGPLFLYDHPVESKPLAKKKATDPSKAASFQLLVGGFEWLNAYNELNDPIDQRARWEEELKLAELGSEEFQMIDEDYIRALEYGMPPTAGWGMGIDRMTAFLTDQHTIKDTILFPTMKPEHPPGTRPASVVVTPQVKGTPLSLTRERAIKLLHDKVQNENLRRHSYSVEAVMRALARKLGGDEDKWGLLGLLHDGDYELTKDAIQKHTILMMDWLKELGETDREFIQAFESHNHERTGFNEPVTLMEWALFCCDELTGLIVAVTLIQPSKKIADVTVEGVLKKWKQKGFAAGANRKDIEQCEVRLRIPLPEFIALTLSAMQAIGPQIGL